MKKWLKIALIYYLPLILWMALIFILSNQPKIVRFEDKVIDFITGKIAHIIEYALLYILWFRAINNELTGKSWKMPLFFTVIYAISDEIHQTFVPTREGKLRDVVIDTVGAFIGLWILNKASRVRIIRKSKGRS